MKKDQLTGPRTPVKQHKHEEKHLDTLQSNCWENLENKKIWFISEEQYD